MIIDTYCELVHEAFSKNGMDGLLTDEKVKKLYELSNLLVETNKTTNLTAITDEKDILLKHFVDSSAVCAFIESGASVIDIVCGAGFPSLPLAILRDDLQITALDSTGKKVEFVKNASSILQLHNINAVCARAEDYVVKYRNAFDVSVSRAVARLNILSELSLPMVKVGGKFIAMKSNRGDEEFEEAKKGISLLGGNLEAKTEKELSFDSQTITRSIYVIKKDRQTPDKYPRKYAQIIKNPL